MIRRMQFWVADRLLAFASWSHPGIRKWRRGRSGDERICQLFMLPRRPTEAEYERFVDLLRTTRPGENF